MRKYKYIWLPAVIFIYFGVMTYMYGFQLLQKGENMRFWLTVAGEMAVLIALVAFLKKRETLRNERENDMKKGK